MSFNSQVEKLLIDPDIISYFTTGDRDILQFIKNSHRGIMKGYFKSN